MYTIHSITHNKWDNSLKPIIRIKSGDIIEVETKEASDNQITPSSTPALWSTSVLYKNL